MQLWHAASQAAALAAWLAAAHPMPVSASDKLDLPEGFSLWQPSASVRVGFGYKDNVALSSINPVTSSFEVSNLEAMLIRLPWNDWMLTAFATGSDTRYFNPSTGIDTEQNVAASAQLGWFPGDGWKGTTTFEYAFVNQVMDVSASYGIPVREKVLGNGFIGKEGVRRTFGSCWAELEFSVSRFLFHEPLDSYWQAGPQATFGCYYGNGSEVSLSYQFQPLAYDNRETVDATGATVPGTHLRFYNHSIELALRHYCDERRHWQLTTKAAFQVNQDNASGYFDYREYRLTEEVTFRPSGWEVSLRASAAYNDTPNQAVSLAEPAGRHRASVAVGLKLEKALTQHWKLYAAYDYDHSFSNLNLEQYQANTGTAGVELIF